MLLIFFVTFTIRLIFLKNKYYIFYYNFIYHKKIEI
jgi:hypothetical protein